MVIGKIKPTATIVAQFAAGVEVEAIQHEGKMFLPIVGMGEFATKGDAPTSAPTKKSEPTPEVSETPAEKPAKSAKDTADKKYTEDELMEMSTKDLLKMCKSMGIDPDDTDGKNTNKKLRNLILEAQDATGTDADDDDEDDDKDGDNELATQVSEILEDFDGGKKNKKKTISAICALVDEADKDAVADLVEKFEDDADADIDKIAEEIANVLAGSADEDADDDDEDDDEDEDEDEKPAPKKSKKSKKGDDLVDVKDLKVGDRVSVWWDDDNQDWYDGEVKSISKKGKVVIAYDDDTEDAIDPEVHTKIKRLDD